MDKIVVLVVILCIFVGASAAGYSYYGQEQATQSQVQAQDQDQLQTQNQTQDQNQTRNQTMNQSGQNSSGNSYQYRYTEMYSLQSEGSIQQSQSAYKSANQNGQNR